MSGYHPLPTCHIGRQFFVSLKNHMNTASRFIGGIDGCRLSEDLAQGSSSVRRAHLPPVSAGPLSPTSGAAYLSAPAPPLCISLIFSLTRGYLSILADPPKESRCLRSTAKSDLRNVDTSSGELIYTTCFGYGLASGNLQEGAASVDSSHRGRDAILTRGQVSPLSKRRCILRPRRVHCP